MPTISERARHIAVLGGSFNPPHIGHVLVSCYVLATSEVDQVWLIPCARHAFGKPLAPFHHRFAMCCLAVEALPTGRVHVSTIEHERHAVSWTIDTVRALKQQSPDDIVSWIVGSDVLPEITQWKDFDQLQHLVSFLVVPRAGFIRPSQASSSDHARQQTDAVIQWHVPTVETLDFQFPNVSSTLIRERLKQRQSIAHLVPKNVDAYIQRHHVYNATDDD